MELIDVAMFKDEDQIVPLFALKPTQNITETLSALASLPNGTPLTVKSLTTLSNRNIYNPNQLSLYHWLFKLLYNLNKQRKTISKRGLYYANVALCKTQNRIDRVVEVVAASLSI